MPTIKETVTAFVGKPDYMDVVAGAIGVRSYRHPYEPDESYRERTATISALGVFLLGPALKGAVESDPAAVRQALRALKLDVG
jgi:hypothetical protein